MWAYIRTLFVYANCKSTVVGAGHLHVMIDSTHCFLESSELKVAY